MTPPSDNQLSEFVARLLKWREWTEAQMGYDSFEGPEPFGEILIHKLPELFFESEQSPIIRDLIEEELGSMDIYVSLSNTFSEDGKPNGYTSLVRPWGRNTSARANDTNKTRAVALAAWNALGGKVTNV